MNITVCYMPADYRGLVPEPGVRTVNIVIDVLRATSTIITGCAHGIAGFFPVSGVEEARAVAGKYPESILAGERGGTKPTGFERGNSPREFCQDRDRGRSVILTTTNGTQAFLAVPAGEPAWAAGFLNLGAVVRQLLQERPDRVRILCAGTGTGFSLEDALVAAALVYALQPEHPLAGLFRAYRTELGGVFARTENGRRLRALGLEADVEWCVQRDRYTRVPRLRPDGWIRTD